MPTSQGRASSSERRCRRATIDASGRSPCVHLGVWPAAFAAGICAIPSDPRRDSPQCRVVSEQVSEFMEQLRNRLQ
jgi:hypothetical protein